MATKSSTALTLVDWAKKLDPNGGTATIVEMLSETNEMIADMPFMECNDASSHRVTQRTGLPAVAYRKMNQGVPPSKSKTAQITEATAMLEGNLEVDVELANLGGNREAFLNNEASAFAESMNQRSQETMIYGSSTSPSEYVGLAERYNDLDAPNGTNILDCGGTGSDNCSIYFMGMSNNTVCGIFPKGSKAGLEVKDLGEDWAYDADGGKFRAYQQQWKIKAGLCLTDWRYVVRIANIKVSDLKAQTGTQAATAATAIMKQMDLAMAQLPRLTGVKLCYYAPRVVCAYLRIAAQDKSQNVLSVEQATNQFGQNVYSLKYMGIPVRMVDKMLTNEAQVVGLGE